MSLTREEFEQLVGRLEARAQADPVAYGRRVVLLAVLGNAYLIGILLLLAAVFVGLLASLLVLKALAVKLAIVVGALLWGVAKALWIPQSEPEGIEVTRDKAAPLFAQIDELCNQLNAAHVDRVLVTDNFNAGVIQQQRLGIFGWPRNFLLIGLPLLSALSVDEWRAVLAHELGHISRGHGRTGSWVYRQRLRWHRLEQMLQTKHGVAGFLFRPFLRWYAPYFLAYSFPLARSNEFEADAASARLTTPQVAASALTRVQVAAQFLQSEFWPSVFRKAEEQPQPGFMPFTGMAHAMSAEVPPERAEGWIAEAMKEQTGVADTHPALKDRLRALGEAPRLAPAGSPRAAQALLGPLAATLAESMDRQWRERVKESWERKYEAVQKDRARLAELDALVAAGTEPTAQQAFDRAMLHERCTGDADGALEQLRALQARLPADGMVALAIGVRLLHRKDPAGEDLVRKAMELNASLAEQACIALRDHCWRNERRDEARQWNARAQEHARAEVEAEKERKHLFTSDKFERHGLSDAELEPLRAGLRALRAEGLGTVYFVRKRVKQTERGPLYVLGYRARTPWFWRRQQLAGELMKRIKATCRFPGESLIISVSGANYRFGRRFFWMRGSRIL